MNVRHFRPRLNLSLASDGALERWSVEALKRWSVGALERWSVEALNGLCANAG